MDPYHDVCVCSREERALDAWWLFDLWLFISGHEQYCL
jgi:hypothetical protein